MLFLLLTALLSASFYLFFKGFEVYRVRVFPAIVFNYFFCALTGAVFSFHEFEKGMEEVQDWLPYSVLLGVLFVTSFFLVATAVQRVSISSSTIASKMSFAVPVLVNLLFYNEKYGLWNYLGLSLAFCAVYLSSVGAKSLKTEIKQGVGLVLAVFLSTGILDTTLNVVQRGFPDEAVNKMYLIVSFFFAFAIGFSILLSQKNGFAKKEVLAGLLLGVPNYFSLYFLLKTLEVYNGNGAFVFPVLSISVIVLSNVLAFCLFKEKISKTNFVGMLVALCAVLFMSALWENIVF